jgi:hypothetical protein
VLVTPTDVRAEVIRERRDRYAAVEDDGHVGSCVRGVGARIRARPRRSVVRGGAVREARPFVERGVGKAEDGCAPDEGHTERGGGGASSHPGFFLKRSAATKSRDAKSAQSQ